MRLASIIVFLLLCLFGCSPDREKGKLELKILSEEIRIPAEHDSMKEPCAGSCPEIVYSLVNNSDEDLMLYNFKRYFNHSYTGLNEVPCDTIIGEGFMTLFVFDGNGNINRAGFSTHDGLDTITHFPERDSFEKAYELWFRNSRVIIKPGESMQFNRKHDFRAYNFVEDTFFIRLSFIQYESWTKDIPELQEDMDGSQLFEGCLSSNDVRLIVGTPRKPNSIFLPEIEVKN